MIGWISSLNLHHLSSANQINAPCWTCPGCVKIVYQLKKLNVKDLLGVNQCHAVKPLTAPKPSNTGHRYKTKPSSFNAHEADFTGWSRVHRRLIEKSSFTRLINAGLENGAPPPPIFVHAFIQKLEDGEQQEPPSDLLLLQRNTQRWERTRHPVRNYNLTTNNTSYPSRSVRSSFFTEHVSLSSNWAASSWRLPEDL